jgi:hypothetical protein
MGLQLKVVSCDRAGHRTNEQSYVDLGSIASKRKTCTILSLSLPRTPLPAPSRLHMQCKRQLLPAAARSNAICAVVCCRFDSAFTLLLTLISDTLYLQGAWSSCGSHSCYILATVHRLLIVCRICELRPKANLTGSCASRGAPAGDHQDRRCPPKGWMAAVKAMAVLLKDPGRRPTNGWGGGEKATSPTAAGPGGEHHHEHHQRLGLCGQGHATGGKPRSKNRLVRSLVWPTTQPAFRAGQWRLRRAVP